MAAAMQSGPTGSAAPAVKGGARLLKRDAFLSMLLLEHSAMPTREAFRPGSTHPGWCCVIVSELNIAQRDALLQLLAHVCSEHSIRQDREDSTLSRRDA